MFEFGIIVGGKGSWWNFNLLFFGEDDLIVGVEEMKFVGVFDFFVIWMVYIYMMDY